MYGLHVHDGVLLRRRDFIGLSIGVVAGLLGGGCGVKSHPRNALTSLTWDEFIQELRQRAEDAYCHQLSEEDYVSEAATLLRRVDRRLLAARRDLAREPRFTISEFALAPGGGFPYHDHRDYNGVILVAEGCVTVRSYEVEGPNRTPPPGQEIRIRETTTAVLGAGEFSTLTTVRDNIHDVRVGGGACRLFDIFTWMGPYPRSVPLDVDEVPIDMTQRVFRAAFRA